MLRCRVLARLAVELYLTDDVALRRRLSEDALAMARRLEDPGALATALYSQQIAIMGPDGLDDREAAVEEILTLADHARDLELAFWGHLFRVWIRAQRCQPVADELAACARLADQLVSPGHRAEVALRRAVLAIEAGDLGEADRLIAAARPAATDPVVSGTLQSIMVLNMYVRGPLDDLEPAVRQLRDDQLGGPMWPAGLACLYVELGWLDDARRELNALARHDFDLRRDGMWLLAMYVLGFVCFAVREATSADTLHRLLLPHADQAPLGVFGSMATAIGLLDAARGRFDDALRWLDDGRRRNLAVDNRAFALWTRREEAAVLLARDGPGDRVAARALLAGVVDELRTLGFDGFLVRAEALLATAGEPAPEPEPAAGELRREGNHWLATYGGRTVPVAASKGMDDLAVLLTHPGREVHAIDLVGAVRAADTGEILDGRALREYRARLAELDEEMAEAEELGDAGRVERAGLEREAIAHELGAALGLGGRARKTGDVSERARKTVTWRIRQAIRAVTDADAALGAHLDESIRTGTFCSYQPDQPTTWRVS